MQIPLYKNPLSEIVVIPLGKTPDADLQAAREQMEASKLAMLQKTDEMNRHIIRKYSEKHKSTIK